MRDPAKKASFLEELGEAVFNHPIWTVVIIAAFEIAIFALLTLSGCAGQRFADGEATVMSPPTYQEVVDQGMAKPEPDQ